MKIKNLLILCALISFAGMNSAHAKNNAIIKHRHSSLYLDGKNVKGTLSGIDFDFEWDDEKTDMCYSGSEKDICELLEIAAQEEKKESRYSKYVTVEVEKCKITKNGLLKFRVTNKDKGDDSERTYTAGDGIPECK